LAQHRLVQQVVFGPVKRQPRNGRLDTRADVLKILDARLDCGPVENSSSERRPSRSIVWHGASAHPDIWRSPHASTAPSPRIAGCAWGAIPSRTHALIYASGCRERAKRSTRISRPLLRRDTVTVSFSTSTDA